MLHHSKDRLIVGCPSRTLYGRTENSMKLDATRNLHTASGRGAVRSRAPWNAEDRTRRPLHLPQIEWCLLCFPSRGSPRIVGGSSANLTLLALEAFLAGGLSSLAALPWLVLSSRFLSDSIICFRPGGIRSSLAPRSSSSCGEGENGQGAETERVKGVSHSAFPSLQDVSGGVPSST